MSARRFQRRPRGAAPGSDPGKERTRPLRFRSHRDGQPQTQNHTDQTSAPLSAAGRDGTRGCRKPYGSRDKGPHARRSGGAATHRPGEPGPRRPHRAWARLAAPSPGCPFRRRAAPAAPRGSPGGAPRPAPERGRPPPARSEPWPPPTAPGGVTRTRGGRGHARGGRGHARGGRDYASDGRGCCGGGRGRAWGRCGALCGRGDRRRAERLGVSCRCEAFLARGPKPLREEPSGAALPGRSLRALRGTAGSRLARPRPLNRFALSPSGSAPALPCGGVGTKSLGHLRGADAPLQGVSLYSTYVAAAAPGARPRVGQGRISLKSGASLPVAARRARDGASAEYTKKGSGSLSSPVWGQLL